jgi:hypothetical protein
VGGCFVDAANEALARRACREAGLPEDVWHRLHGDSYEELLDDARDLAFDRDYPPDPETTDRLGRALMEESAAKVRKSNAKVEAAKAARDVIVARQELREAELAALNSQIAMLRAEIADRLAIRDVRQPAPRPREHRAGPRRAGAGSRTSRGDPSRPADEPEPPLDQRRLRPPPQLSIGVPYEGQPQFRVHADSYEDEQRLLLWLHETDVLLDLARDVLRLVARLLDPEDEAEP